MRVRVPSRSDARANGSGVKGSGSTGRLIRRADLKPKKKPTDAQLLASAKRAATTAKRRGKVIG